LGLDIAGDNGDDADDNDPAMEIPEIV